MKISWKINISNLSFEEQYALINSLVVNKDYVHFILRNKVNFLYGKNRILLVGDSEAVFNDFPGVELEINNIPNYTPDKRALFVAPDKVLVRNSNNDPWRVALYSHMEGNFYITSSGKYKQCITFVNNEHLVGI